MAEYNGCNNIMSSVKVTRVGNSGALILSKEVLARLRVGIGDSVHLSEAPNGGLLITPYDPEFEEQMRLAEEIMRKDRNILRALSK